MKEINDISREDWNRLKDHIKDKNCQSADCVVIGGAFSLRVSELCNLRPADLKENELHIHQSKGGRDRDLIVHNKEQLDALNHLKELAAGLNEHQRIFTVQSDSINKFYRENAKAVNIKDSEIFGLHQLRRMGATEMYHELRAAGSTDREASDAVSEMLGHGSNRADVERSYIKK